MASSLKTMEPKKSEIFMEGGITGTRSLSKIVLMDCERLFDIFAVIA